MSETTPLSDADIERMAALIGLTVAPAHRAAVAQQLTGLLAAARLFADFPLGEDVEPAPGFRP